MKKNLLALTLLSVLCGLVVIAAASSPQSAPTTQLLTNPVLTVYNAEIPQVVLGPANLYTAWSEYAVYNPGGNTTDADFFYASLPGNNTQRLRDAAAVTNGLGLTNISYYEIARGSNGLIYLAWIEPTSNYGSDVFFWKTGMSAPQNVSNHTLTATGDAAYLHLALDDNDIPHLLWAEKQPSQVSIYYWDEVAGTSKISTTIPTAISFTLTRALDLIAEGDVVHAFWYDRDVAQGWTVYYWNSDTQTPINIRAGEPDLSDPIFYVYALVNNNGVFHAVWYEPHSPQASKIVHWDSASQTLHTLLLATPPYVLPPVLDSQGNVHVITYVINGAMSHWDSQSMNTVQITPNIASFIPKMVAGTTSNLVHVAWAGADSNWPTHLNDMFYWRPGLAQPRNITDHSQAPATISNSSFLSLAAANDGSVHIAWEEGLLPTYYHSGSNSTTTLNNTVKVQFDMLWSPTQVPATSYLGSPGHIFRVYQNTAYWFLASTSSNTTTPHVLWRASNNSYTPIPAVHGPTNPTDHSARMLWFDRLGRPQLSWFTTVSGELTNLHYWSSVDGSFDVSDSANTTSAVEGLGIVGATDTYGRVYLVWREGQSDDQDVYAMVKEPGYTSHIFLPFVRQ